MNGKIKSWTQTVIQKTRDFFVPKNQSIHHGMPSTKKLLKSTLRMAKMTIQVFKQRHPVLSRVFLIVIAILFLFLLIADPLQILLRREPKYTKNIDTKVLRLLPEETEQLNSSISYKEDKRVFAFNEGYQMVDKLGFGGGAKFSSNIYVNPSKGIDIRDAANDVQMNIKPNFDVSTAKRDNNRIFYELLDYDGVKVVSLGASGYKEDIVLKRYQGDKLSFDYDLSLPDGIEPRLEADGSVGFYGVDTSLLGNVSAGSEADEELLKQARVNGEKNNLIFRIPAPIVLELDRQQSQADAYFELEGNTLTTVATNLKEANYPISIDPSVYVETARKFLRGNEETNVDFDVDNDLIQKGTTTGARFNSWNSTMGLNDGRFDGSSVTAGGYAYYVGGVSGSATENVSTFTTPGTDTWNVPAGVTSITVELWGGGGGGGGGSSNSSGGDGGGAGYASSTISVTPAETITVEVGGGGGEGDRSSGGGGTLSGDGGGGGGHSEVRRGGTPLVIAPGGGGGGGGDNSGPVPGGTGGAGGDENNGIDGGNSSSSGGGFGATSSSGGSGGSATNNGSAGGSQSGGDGADGRSGQGSDGSKNNGGTNNGGDGGNGDENANGYGAGGGGGSGYYGGGGGGGSVPNDAGGGGGGGGTAYFDAGVSGQTAISGSNSTPGNEVDADRAGAGEGGSGGTSGSGTAGTDGIVVIKYFTSVSNTTESSVMWANIDDNSGVIDSPNPGAGACAQWCTNSVYDLPDERRGFSLVAYNGFLYAIGGLDDTGTRQSSVYIAKIGANGEPQLWHPTDDNQNNWVYWYSDTALPAAVSYSAAVGYNNRLYLVGGQTDANPGGVTTVRYTDVEPTGTLSGWTTTGVVSLSTARFMHSLEVYNDYLYVIGGDSSSSGALLDTVEYVKVGDDGTFEGSWESTSSFIGARRTNGGKFTAVYGAYIYLTGGCTSVSGGNCQTVGSEVQIASIFADGSLGEWSTDSNATNSRVSYGMHTWQGNVYRVGGCTQIISTSDGCVAALDSVEYGVINPPGEVSTVNITETPGVGSCTGGNPRDCDMPATGDGAGEGGQMLSMAIVLNGYLYNIGGCTNFACSNSSGNVSYVQIASDGSLQRESTCVANGNSYADSGNSAWCVDSTNRVNGTSGISAAGVTVFNNRIYLVGGIDESTTGTQAIYYNAVNTDGSLSGGWSSVSLAAAGLTGYSEISYTYAFARANPNEAATNPGNLFVLGGCDSFGASAGCSSSYATETYKCNIENGGAVSGCTTSGQLQIDVELSTGGNQGLGLHSGTVYANYIYLIGGFSDNVGDRDTVFYAKIDDNNNIVDVDSGTAGGAGDDWIESTNTLDVGRRRGWAFGYNGHIYAVGGYDDTGTGIIPFIEWSKLNVSDGSLEEFVTSTITINQRWGLTMVVSNSFAYVLGGCDVGPSPGGCSSFEPSVQTFQLYNNDSGAQANYTESTGEFDTLNSRIGSSSAILDGFIYVAGGMSGGNITDNVQVAKLNANGTIGTWNSTSASLPGVRAYGQLETAGGSLYYVGGSNDQECDPTGDAFFEKYDSIAGTAIGDLYADPDFPGSPSSTQDITGGSLESPINIDDNFGGRLSALICPPQDGNYTFWIASDDSSELRLSTDTNPANVSTVASVSGWTGVDEWDKFSSQESSPVSLNAGQYYYIEANYKEGGGGDHVQIGWTLPDATLDRPISDTYYSKPSETSAVTMNARNQVYYANPTTGSSTSDVVRSTTYKLASGEFTGTNYTLTLDDDLANDYFVMVAGGDDSGGTSGPDHSQIRVDGDPFSNLVATTSADEIRLARGDASANWVGSVTVVECVSSCATEGFQLSEVLDVSLANGNLSSDTTLASAHSANTVPFGGYLGGGLSTTESNNGSFSATAGVRVRKNSTNQIRIERNDTQGTAAAADVTVYVVEWGSAWNVQEANIDDWNTGGQGVDDVSEYATAAISSVTRDNTWVWKSPGTSEQNGLGDGAFGKVVTLGDGVNQNATETSIAIGSEPAQAADIRDDTIYVLEHPDLNTDYRFVSRSNYGTSFTATVDTAQESETVSTTGNVTTSAGYRIPLFYYTDNGTGTAYTRVAGWSHYHSNDTTISFAKSFSGNNQSGWIQSVDFGDFAGTSGERDITTWSTASNGLPVALTQFGAAVWNDRIYVVGGLDSAGSPVDTVYISPKLSSGGDITTAWASDTDTPEVARSGGAVIAYANNLYLLGGNDGSNYFSDVQFTTIGYKTGTISQSGNTLAGSGTSWSASMVGSEVQYADGSTANITGYTSPTSLTVDASKNVDPGTRYLIDDGSVGDWSFTTSLPQQVSDADGFASNGFMYLVGGRSMPGVCTNNSYVAPVSANTTIATGNNPTGLGEWYQTNVEYTGARHSSAVSYNEGKIYISGGGCTQATTDTYTFDADNDADESAWTFVSDNGTNGLNPSGTNRAWSHETDDTPSSGVGPTSGQGGNPDGYIYTEASSPAAGNDTFHITRNATIDATAYDWTVEFYWNQRGDDNTATLDVQTNENSAGWVTRDSYGGGDVGSSGSDVWNFESLDLSTVISDASTEVRFLVTFPGSGTIWHNDFGLDNITLRGAESVSGELTDNQHYIGTLRAQPQVARYSYYIDADSDVFPDAWLLNGLDNNIGARWQFDYRSSTDANNAWGENTAFGDVTLGRVEGYTPLDESGVDTELARYFYVTMSIDASQTFGYPDDVNRGPTIDDFNLFFTSDPNKRLRHGKTFIQGLQQPLDTPCRVSGASPAGSQPNCPLP